MQSDTSNSFDCRLTSVGISLFDDTAVSSATLFFWASFKGARQLSFPSHKLRISRISFVNEEWWTAAILDIARITLWVIHRNPAKVEKFKMAADTAVFLSSYLDDKAPTNLCISTLLESLSERQSLQGSVSKKCYRKMHVFRWKLVLLLFVSWAHNLVEKLCLNCKGITKI